MAQLFWFLIWSVLFAGWSTPVIPAESRTAEQAPVQTAQSGEPFVLAQGANAVLADGDVIITFERVVEDSRCPTDVMCAWSGMVTVALRVEAAGSETQVVELGGFTDYEGMLRPQRAGLGATSSAEVGGYTVELLAVTPYPAHNDAPPAEAEYQLQLVVNAS